MALAPVLVDRFAAECRTPERAPTIMRTRVRRGVPTPLRGRGRALLLRGCRLGEGHTMATTATRPALSDDRLVEMMKLVEDADSVELKLTVPSAGHRTAIRALDLDPLEAQIRQVYFFDTPDLALNRAGVVARARRVQGKGEDSVVKLRPVVPEQIPSGLRKLPEFVIEV